MSSSFDSEQIKLLTEVEDIRNKSKVPKRTGHEVCIVISKYIQRHLSADYKVAGPDVYVDGVSTEFDLLVVRAGAQSGVAGYEPSDVRVVLEVKTAGIRKKKGDYPREIEKIRGNFDKVRMRNTRIWGALLMCYGTIYPAKPTSIDYEKIHKDGLEPYDYGVYTLADTRKSEPEWGKWQRFIEDLLRKLD
jgi:hypothetical protein